jgi:hypothetical protein
VSHDQARLAICRTKTAKNLEIGRLSQERMEIFAWTPSQLRPHFDDSRILPALRRYALAVARLLGGEEYEKLLAELADRADLKPSTCCPRFKTSAAGYLTP